MTGRDGALRRILAEGIEEGVAVAASAWVWRDGAVVARAWAGTTRLDGGMQVGPGTLFDVASLTKPAAACLALRLVASGRADPGDRPVAGSDADLGDLLAHRAGFEAWLPLHERVDARAWGTDEARHAVIEAASASERAASPRTRTIYSDLGYISLVPYLEERAGSRLDAALREHVTGPLGLGLTVFRPLEAPGVDAAAIAATERIERRGGVICGIVHDDNAACMGGISSHAGLFSTASDVGSLGAAFLESGHGRDRFLPVELARWGLEPAEPGGHTVAWDTRSPTGSSAGRLMGGRTVGHLGYTGCSIWMDPDERLVIVLLTNRVHPTSTNEAIKRFRPAFHDAVISGILA